MSEQQLTKFKDVLKQIFEMDKADLDFGIYRIINQKRDDINSFLDKDLLPQVRNELIAAGSGDMEGEVFSHLTIFFSRYYDKGDFISKRRYKEGVYAIPYEGEEVKLYWANHDQYYIKTSEYFKNYTFKAGDKKIHFRIIEGEQNRDNTKSDDDKNRKFVLNDETNYEIENNELIIYFKYIKDDRNQARKATTKADTFSKYINVSAAQELLAIKEINTQFPELKAIYSQSSIPNLTLLEKNLNDYTARNSFDYFIHKDLGGFLRRELDFFIKNEVMHIDDLNTENEMEVNQYLSKIKVIKNIGQKIISFLEQLENFQKKLWLKKKFIVQCDYCITLDRIPEEFYSEIIKNNEQIEEWKKLFAIDELTEKPVPGRASKAIESDEKEEEDEDNDSLFDEDESEEIKELETIDKDSVELPFVKYTEPLTVDFLKANPYLVLDTKFYTDDVKWKIIASIDDIDEQCDGVLINSENFQALGLLQEKYREKIKCIYIDPPYNAQSSEILYKNTFKHSSWLSLIQDRLIYSKPILYKLFVYIIAIDEVENTKLSMMLSDLFTDCEDACISIVHNPTGQQGKNFSFTHEFAHFIYPENIDCIGLENREDASRESKPDIRPLRNVSSGVNHLRSSAANCFYPIYIKEGKIIEFGDVCDDDFHPSGINIIRDDGVVEVYPIDPSNIESKWVFARNTVESILDELTAEFDTKKNTWDIIRKKSKFRYKSLWADKRYSANSWGSVLLNNIILKNPFLYPKSIYAVRDCIDAGLNNQNLGIILDYFAGSGTTGHAVINLNREDGGKRKYILVEMGQYFDTVLKTRIQKVVYSKDWKKGKPVSRKGSSHMFKYMRLESYEDCLNNLYLKDKEIQATLEKLPQKAKEDYILNYMLDIETSGSDSLLNIDKMKNPFNYTLKIIRDNEMQEEKVDLVETFNYLIGLYVKKRHVPSRVSLVFTRNVDGRLVVKEEKASGESFILVVLEGENREGESVLVIWRVLGKDIEKDNTALMYYYKKHWSSKNFDLIYVNGEHTLPGAQMIEDHFKRLMFDNRDV